VPIASEPIGTSLRRLAGLAGTASLISDNGASVANAP
jgi:hypothetical protein